MVADYPPLPPPRRADDPDEGPPEAVVLAPAFTAEQVAQDGKDRVTRTGGQNAVALAIVTVGEWAAHQAGWHGTLPTAVSGAIVLLVTVAGSYLMNRGRIRATKQ